MDVRERVDPGHMATRCPFCHDLLAAPDAEQVECGGCGTRHHAACLEELGRCTVLGCTWSPPRGERSTAAIRDAVRSRAAVFAERRARAAAQAAAARALEAPPREGPPIARGPDEAVPWSVPRLTEAPERVDPAAAARELSTIALLLILLPLFLLGGTLLVVALRQGQG